MLNAFRFMLYSELLLLWRRSQEWLYPVAFFVIIVSLFPLALSVDPTFLKKMLPGYLWIAALLASLLSIENSYATDVEDGNIEQLLLSQVPLSLFVLAKLCAQWIATELPLIILTPLLGLLFHLPANTILILCLSLLLGTPILTMVGSLGAALTLGLRQRGVLLGLLLLPLTIPVLIFGVSMVQQSQAGLSIVGPIVFLTGLLVLTLTVLPYPIAAALRVSLDE